MRPTLLVLLLACVPGTVHAFEASARLGISSPQGDSVGLGPTLGLSALVPLRGRISILANGDYSSHAVVGTGHRIDALTATLGLEAAIDLSPIVPVVSVGPAFQHAWRRDSPASSDKFGGFLGVGIRMNVLDHLRLGVQARYLTTAFTADGFPAFATFVVEVGWTS